MRNVTTSIVKPNHSCRNVAEGTIEVAETRSDEVAVGNIRCDSWRAYTFGCQISILRANRQIYREAWGIFHLENFWTIVRVNKAGFGKEMKDRGFLVLPAGDLWLRTGFPVMKVKVDFPSLEDQEQNDVLAVASIHLKQLMRALWTAKGASEMEVMITIQPPLMDKSPSQRDLLEPFFKLRGIKRVSILGVSKQRDIDQLTRKITTTDGLNQTFNELTAGVRRLQRYIKARQWELAIGQAEKHAIRMTDCKTVYGNRFIGIERGLNNTTAVARGQAALEIIIATAIGFAEVTLCQYEYINTISFVRRALYALHVFSRVSNFLPGNPGTHAIVVPPRYPLLPITGTVPFENEIKCVLLLIRARAYMGIERGEPAMEDIQKARELMPNSMTLVSVSQTWHYMFGPYP